MFNKLKKLFRGNKCHPCIHNCLLCEQDIYVKKIYKTKCCGRIYHKCCYRKWKRLFGFKPCCFN